MSEISPQTSAYIPIMVPPRSHPPYVTADLRHKWNSSALLTMAMESVTLPTRLRRHGGLGSWLVDTESRKIFNLQSAVIRDESGPAENVKPEADDLIKEDQDDDQSHQLLEDFHIDFSPFDQTKSNRVHVFTQARVARDSRIGTEGAMQADDARQNLGMLSQPNVQR